MNSDDEFRAIPRDATFPSFYHSETFEEYGEAYFLAAKILWEATPKNDLGIPRPDYLILPVLFLLHHYIELELKEIIRLSHSVGSLTDTPVDDVPDTHNLVSLLKKSNSNIEKLRLEKNSFLDQDQSELIADFQKFASQGEALRYPHKTKKGGGGPTLPPSFVADVAAVFERIEGISFAIEGPLGELREIEAMIEAMEVEMRYNH